MMQQVATTKSEVAALAAIPTTDIVADKSASQQDFGQMLEQQQSHSSHNEQKVRQSDKSDGMPTTSSADSKSSEIVSQKGTGQTPDSGPVKTNEQRSDAELSTTDDRVTTTPSTEASDLDEVSDKVVETKNAVVTDDSAKATAEPKDIVISNGQKTQQTESQQLDGQLDSADERQQLDVWVSLVDSLQQYKNSEIEPSQKSVNPETESPEIIEQNNIIGSIFSDESSVANKHNFDQELTSGLTVSNAPVDALNQSDAEPSVIDNTLANEQGLKSSPLEALPPQSTDKAVKLIAQHIVKISKEQNSDAAVIDGSEQVSAKLDIKNIQNVLADPATLQNLIKQVNQEITTKEPQVDGGKALNEQDVEIIVEVLAASLLSEHKQPVSEKLAIEVSETKASLTDSVPSIEEQVTEATSEQIIAHNKLETPSVLSTPIEEETASNISIIEGVIKGGEGDDQNNDFTAKNTLEQNASTEIVENESEAEQQPVLGNEHGLSETLVQEQSSDIELIAPDILNKASSSLGILLAIPEAKLDKVLVKIAQSVFPNNASEPSVGNSSSLTFSSIDNIKPAIDTASIGQGLQDLTSAMTGPAKDFVSALKSGLAEFKQQAVQGREPGIDLKSIFSEALHKAAIANPAANIPVNQEQVLSNVTQILDVATGLSRALDSSSHSVAATYGALQREATQVQGEQTKQLQTTQLEQKFEKAVNISKPEGLQQLAEKVRWMANAKNLVAEIRLDPAELGSVHVKVAMSGESATVNFVVQSQHAREAMDQAAPRLREMLAEKGIELGQSSVRQESGQGNEREQELASEQGHKRDTNEDDEEQNLSTIEQPVINGALGGIDYFA